MAKAKGDVSVSAREFIEAYRDAKDLTDLKKKLHAIDRKEWSVERIDSKAQSLRIKGVPIKSLRQRGWIEGGGKARLSIEELTKLLSKDIMASEDQMPKKRAK